MELYGNLTDPKVVVVVFQNGDDTFGQTVFEYYRSLPNWRNHPFAFLLVIANPEAVRQGVRYVDIDMDRSFPGSLFGWREHRQADMLLQLIRNLAKDGEEPYVLDIRTTTSKLWVTPIVTKLEVAQRRIINLASPHTYSEVVVMGEAFARTSLIGNIQKGASLQFGLEFSAQASAITVVDDVVRGICDQESGLETSKRVRQVYYVDDTIPLTVKLPEGVRNFDYIPGLGYGFMMGERSYRKTHQGFVAKRMEEQLI